MTILNQVPYEGNIEIVAGFIPKNNGNFPLMRAQDVLDLSSGKRLDAIIAELLILQGYKLATLEDIETLFNDQI